MKTPFLVLLVKIQFGSWIPATALKCRFTRLHLMLSVNYKHAHARWKLIMPLTGLVDYIEYAGHTIRLRHNLSKTLQTTW